MRASPHHHAKETMEVCGVHDDDDLVRSQFLLQNFNALQLPLHPLGTASVLPGNISMALFAMREFSPDFFGVVLSLFTTFLPACDALPNLPTIVCAVPLE